jgi:hypothetical protein
MKAGNCGLILKAEKGHSTLKTKRRMKQPTKRWKIHSGTFSFRVEFAWIISACAFPALHISASCFRNLPTPKCTESQRALSGLGWSCYLPRNNMQAAEIISSGDIFQLAIAYMPFQCTGSYKVSNTTPPTSPGSLTFVRIVSSCEAHFSPPVVGSFASALLPPRCA